MPRSSAGDWANSSPVNQFPGRAQRAVIAGPCGRWIAGSSRRGCLTSSGRPRSTTCSPLSNFSPGGFGRSWSGAGRPGSPNWSSTAFVWRSCPLRPLAPNARSTRASRRVRFPRRDREKTRMVSPELPLRYFSSPVIVYAGIFPCPLPRLRREQPWTPKNGQLELNADFIVNAVFYQSHRAPCFLAGDDHGIINWVFLRSWIIPFSLKLGRLHHRHDAGADHFGQVGLGVLDGGQVRVATKAPRATPVVPGIQMIGLR